MSNRLRSDEIKKLAQPQAAEEAHKKIETMPKGRERLETWLTEMGKELEARGITI